MDFHEQKYDEGLLNQFKKVLPIKPKIARKVVDTKKLLKEIKTDIIKKIHSKLSNKAYINSITKTLNLSDGAKIRTSPYGIDKKVA